MKESWSNVMRPHKYPATIHEQARQQAPAMNQNQSQTLSMDIRMHSGPSSSQQNKHLFFSPTDRVVLNVPQGSHNQHHKHQSKGNNNHNQDCSSNYQQQMLYSTTPHSKVQVGSSMTATPMVNLRVNTTTGPDGNFTRGFSAKVVFNSGGCGRILTGDVVNQGSRDGNYV